MTPSLLAPAPQRVEELGKEFVFPSRLGFESEFHSPDVEPALQRLESVLAVHGSTVERVAGADFMIRLFERPGKTPAQGYRLGLTSSGLELVAADAAGAFYGLHTLSQWIEGTAPQLSGEGRPREIRIADWPDLDHRGVMLDVSRSRVPTMETLFELIDRLSSWKINQLQLYTEHTFAYRGHERVWQGASPLTKDEIRSLDAYCGARHVELVPNQNSFGHMHRWLRLPEYRALAECPDGLEHPFSSEIEPFSLCPTDPASLDLLRDLYDQLLPNFTSSQLNIGFDETLDLGSGRSRERVAEVGAGAVYLGFLRQVCDLVTERGRRIQYWGDIVAKHPEIIDRLPRDSTVMVWGYEADHPFDQELSPLAEHRLPFYVCPGTSSWLSFAGRVDNTLANIAAAVNSGVRFGAQGLLITDWGDRGHLQPLPVSMPGLLAGAACAWNASTAEDWRKIPIREWLERHAFRAEPAGFGGALLDLGNLYQRTGARSFNASPLFYLALSPELPLSHPRLAGLEEGGLESCMEPLRRARTSLESAAETRCTRELRWVCDLLELGVRTGLARMGASATESALELTRPVRGELSSRLRALIGAHEALWMERSRPGGRLESRAVLEAALSRLSDEPPALQAS